MILPALLKAVDVGLAVAQKVVEWNDARVAKKRAQDHWSKAPAVIRGCPRCHEIAYTPGQVACNKCGAFLAG
jgi:hypothetical protein